MYQSIEESDLLECFLGDDGLKRKKKVCCYTPCVAYFKTSQFFHRWLLLLLGKFFLVLSTIYLLTEIASQRRGGRILTPYHIHYTIEGVGK